MIHFLDSLERGSLRRPHGSNSGYQCSCYSHREVLLLDTASGTGKHFCYYHVNNVLVIWLYSVRGSQPDYIHITATISCLHGL